MVTGANTLPWRFRSVGSGETSVVFNQTLCSVTGITNSSHTLRMGMYAQDASVLDVRNTLSQRKVRADFFFVL